MELFYNQNHTCWGLREYAPTPATRRDSYDITLTPQDAKEIISANATVEYYSTVRTFSFTNLRKNGDGIFTVSMYDEQGSQLKTFFGNKTCDSTLVMQSGFKYNYEFTSTVNPANPALMYGRGFNDVYSSYYQDIFNKTVNASYADQEAAKIQQLSTAGLMTARRQNGSIKGTNTG